MRTALGNLWRRAQFTALLATVFFVTAITVQTATAESSRKVWQGGLVDLRYGQLALDQGGVGRLVLTDERTRWTLNGAPSDGEKVAVALAAGASLTAVVEAADDGLRADWVDLYGQQGASPSAALQVDLQGAPALTPQGRATYSLSPAEQKRLELTPFAVLTVPGLVRNLRPEVEPSGALRYRLPAPEELDLVDTPSFLSNPGSSTAFRGPAITVSSSGPRVVSFGPERVSLRAEVVPGWLDLESPAGLLDPHSIEISASPGLEVVRLERRVDRSQFFLRPEGLGQFEVRASARDRLGRRVEKSWWVTVGP